MQPTNFSLPIPPEASKFAIHDADIDESGNVLLGLGDERADRLLFPESGSVQLPEAIFGPKVRFMTPDIAFVAYPRVRSEAEKNAWFINKHGHIESNFAIGDGVANVIRTKNFLVVSYFDEGVYSRISPSWNGVAVFDLQGRLRWGWNDDIAPKGFSFIDDCYAVAEIAADQIAVFSWQGFDLAVVDLESRAVSVCKTPPLIHGSSSLSRRGGSWLFRDPYGAKGSLFAWEEGKEPVLVARLPVAVSGRRSRGLRGGRFLDVHRTGVEVLTVSSD